MSPNCHACGQRCGKVKAPLLDLVPPVEDAPTMEKKNNKNKSQDKAATAEVNKTEVPWVINTLENLLDYVHDWIPGYHFAKRVVENLYRRPNPTASLTISSVYTVFSTDPIVNITKKRKRQKHKKTPSIPASPV
ncbi:hypothetical protein SMACR_08812 [Sordaria macrospora]|uniref:WGS project CABT00000000 data, contig 2.66 n=2 Tax=Sordaria macrospora TaxID=5147 RepID=F7WAV8_SORMK|nr:uncharacterized protein SMAC_08812 [Sordaria macrospora k-hell]KAA8628294.1 hypothetical protein SMACR_08812 [Sordaria macrospora]WPJ62817.1 hypothetical protein SMAC4_08812 [Sordaria macrospora]CCC14273.1 unnamed protein product [Sordaria macrospora k-hell]